jgi:hypothetical protein
MNICMIVKKGLSKNTIIVVRMRYLRTDEARIISTMA